MYEVINICWRCFTKAYSYRWILRFRDKWSLWMTKHPSRTDENFDRIQELQKLVTCLLECMNICWIYALVYSWTKWKLTAYVPWTSTSSRWSMALTVVKMCSWIRARSKTTVFIQEISLLVSKEDVLIFRNCQSIWWGNLRERDLLENRGIPGRIILRWIFRKWDVGAQTGLIWLRIKTGVQPLWIR